MISQRRGLAGHERGKFMELIGLLSAAVAPEEMLRALLPLLQHWSDCEAVGIRLRAGHGHPYVETEGFAENFIRLDTERRAQDEDSGMYAAPGISGQSSPLFTPHGSFWNNGFTGPHGADSRELLAADPGSPSPQSMALVPLRYQAETFGILLFNDSRPGRFDPDLISFLEKLADTVALALSRIQAEQARKESEELYRSMFCANVAIMLLVEPDTGAIIDANPAASQYYGYSHKELLRLKIFDLNTMAKEQVGQLMGLARTSNCKHFLFKHRLAGGSIRDVEVYTGPIQRLGRPLLFSIVHDVTDRVRAEDMGRRVEGMLRHDLKSPLTGMIGLSRLVEENISGGRVKEWATALREGSEGMFELVERNLDVFKMEQGLYTLRPEPCDLARILRRLHSGMAPALERREVEMELLLGEDLLPAEAQMPIKGNRALLSNLFSNLLQNAQEASPNRGKVTVAIEREAAALRVVIHNQGAVPEEIRERFFHKYVSSGKAHGTGLGTYSARLIARAHGGDVGFTTSEKEGTRVLVTLPAHPENQAG